MADQKATAGAVLFAVAALAAASPCAAADFTLTSPTIRSDAALPQKHLLDGFGCTGDNLSPALSWAAPPAGTRSYALSLYDSDAPTGSGWWHWVVFDLPATATGLPEGAGSSATGGLPAGAVQSRTDFGSPGYGGPCPPEGDRPHRYVFTLTALAVDSLPLDQQASGAMVGFFVRQNAIASTSLTVVFGR